MRSLNLLVVLATVAGLSCGAPLPGVPGSGGGSGRVDPNTCGNYAASDAGRKLKNFFEATVQLNDTVTRTANVIKESCRIMGTELAMTPGRLEGQTKDVCNAVFAQLNDDLKVGLKAQAALKVEYKPAVCVVDVKAAAEVAAQCEAKASGDIKVECEGSCSGTCGGTCEGTCHGTMTAGKCSGHCDGVCRGSCDAGCEGGADVQASAECEAKAEVQASVEAKCTPAELTVEADATMMVDKVRAERAINAMKKGLPEILSVKARIKPMQLAMMTWINAANGLAKAGGELAQSFGDQALCISGQIAGAAAMIANIQASFSVSVEVSASASASVGG